MRFKHSDNQRCEDRRIEERHKAAKRRASKSGGKVAPKVEPLKPGEKSLARRLYEALTSWKSKKTVARERAVAERAAAEEAKKLAEAKA